MLQTREERSDGYSLCGSDGGSLVANLPQAATDADVRAGHEGEGQQVDDQQHVQLVHLVHHRLGPLLQAPVALASPPHQHVLLGTQHDAIQYSTIQYSTIQHSAIQYNTAQHNTIQRNAIQYTTA